nr:uncharacterized protein LOC113711449 [Coffea arabica]
MADELEEVLKKFALSKIEQDGAWLELDDFDPGVSACMTSIIGKIRGEKVANFTGVKNFVNAAWGYPKDLTITELGPNLFQFFIPDVENRTRILNGGPWLIDNQILVLNRWEAGIEENTEAFRFAPLWVQVWNLPIHWISKEVGRKIGKVFEEVKEVLIPYSRGKEGKHLKLLVSADLSKPLLRGTTVKTNGVLKWVNFRYERVPDFCYNCGIVGHSEKKCKNVVTIRKGQQENQFGPWLRAQVGKNSPQKDDRTSTFTSDKQEWGFHNGEWVKKSGGKCIVQEGHLNRSGIGKEGKESMSKELVLQGQVERVKERAQTSGQEDEDIQEAQETDWSKKVEEVSKDEEQTPRPESSENGKEISEMEPSAVGEMGNRIQINELDDGGSMKTAMQVDGEEPIQAKCVGTRRGRKVKLLNKISVRDRTPLRELQNLEHGSELNTKRKLHIVDEEMVETADVDTTTKRNKVGNGKTFIGRDKRVEETSPVWSLNHP